MNIEEIKAIILHELPNIVRTDEEVRRLILDLGREQFLDQSEANRRFDRILDELAEQRKENHRKWETWEKRWEEYRQKSDEDWKENQRKWDENQQRSDEKWKENQRKWDDNQRKWDDNQQRWEENRQKWEENQQRWEENQKVIREMLASIKALDRRIDSTIGALGARWGLYSEESFRNGLKGILEENLGLEVMNINEFDDEGYVFGRPEQVELDIVVKDGTLIICELKSSMSISEMYTFERKVKFYEKRHKRNANKLIVISPMVDKRAKVVADQLGIEVYTHSDDVEEL